MAAALRIQSDWSRALRRDEGEAWLSCRSPGKPTLYGSLTRRGLSTEGVPDIAASEGFVVGEVTKKSILVSCPHENASTKFLAPFATFPGIHQKSVTCLDISSGGGLGVSASTDGTMKIWQAANGEMRVFPFGPCGSQRGNGRPAKGLVGGRRQLRRNLQRPQRREGMALEVETWQPLRYQLSLEASLSISLLTTSPCAGQWLLLRVICWELLPSTYLFAGAVAPCPVFHPPRSLPACSLRALLCRCWHPGSGASGLAAECVRLPWEMSCSWPLSAFCAVSERGLSFGAGILDTAVVDRGRNVLSCSRDGTARLWDCGKSACLAVVADCGSPVNGIAVGAADNSVNLGAPEKTPSEREIGTEGKILLLAREDKKLQGVGLQSRQPHRPRPCEKGVASANLVLLLRACLETNLGSGGVCLPLCGAFVLRRGPRSVHRLHQLRSLGRTGAGAHFSRASWSRALGLLI
ncbi:proteasomal ATPase-associated factor 1 isoform X2 [Cygnus olor]|uniref:proteasomal ATPase-associated factor 1 isoform X2 n=1 Tax=Cygnus olor TaxID=8869 RepID=UPI001ADE3099|nr:proteasomal ATPase-associated factor 1 isoform X2 [Cygnus olor]